MLRTLGIVLVDHETDDDGFSSLSPTMYVGRRLGGRRVLEWTVRRLTESQRLDGVIVALPADGYVGGLSDFVPADVPVYRYENADRLGAVASASNAYPAESVVVVPASSPFIDPDLVDRLIISAESDTNCDYASYHDSEEYPSLSSHIGLVAEWIKTSALRQANAESIDRLDSRELACSLLAYPHLFKLRWIPLPESLDRKDVCLTLTDEEDWDRAEEILEVLSPDQLDWQEITRLLDLHPSLQADASKLPAR